MQTGQLLLLEPKDLTRFIIRGKTNYPEDLKTE